MKRVVTLATVIATVSLVMLALADLGICWQPSVPPMGMPMGQMGAPCPPVGCGPAPMPIMGPCFPGQSCTTLSVEGGGRLLYASNGSVKLTIQGAGGGTIDFVRDLNFSQSLLLGEVYAGVRISPTLAFTYTFMIPREDDGHGVLNAGITIDNTVFAAGTPVAVKSLTTVHRWEGEVYPIVGCNYRVGGLLLGELFVQRFRFTSGAASDSQVFNEFLMGVGGVAEVSPADGVYARVKGAYTFLQNHNGFYIDGEGKYFPEMKSGCGGVPSGVRPYVSAGYRFRYGEWTRNDGNLKLESTVHGPYVGAGVIF